MSYFIEVLICSSFANRFGHDHLYLQDSFPNLITWKEDEK